MKKSRIFMAVGTVALAITAMFATKANKKFALRHTAYIGGTGLYIVAPSAIFTATKPTGFYTAVATLYTTGSSHHSVLNVTLYTSASEAQPLYVQG